MITPEQDSPDWWEVFHVPEMADLFLVRNDAEELQQTLDFLESELALRPGALVYDQCCGIGSLSIALAQKGYHATGADLCDFYIERAIQDARVAGVDCDFHCADALKFVPATPCEAALNWYSSFGYAHSDQRNREMLERACDALVAGGRFALDVPNLPGLLRGFQRFLVRRGESQGRAVTVIRESTVNLQDGLLEQTWCWLISGERPVTKRSALRLYLPHQIRELLEQAGFVNVRFFGSVTGDSFEIDSPRLILVAERPAG